MGEILRGINVVMVVACFVGFTPAIVHARDNVDRLYLMGGAILLAAVALSSVVHYRAPISVATPLYILGQIVWGFSALASHRRRRRTLDSNQGKDVRRAR